MYNKKHKKLHNKKGDFTDELDISILDDPEICPECNTRTIILDTDKCEEYCTNCGTITRAASRYVAGNQFDLPKRSPYMTETYKYKSKAANAIVFIAGLITYIGRDNLLQILPEKWRYLAPIIVLLAGYIVVQATENTRVAVAEQLAVENYQSENMINPANEEMAGDKNEQ